jgi:hypothetical protein
MVTTIEREKSAVLEAEALVRNYLQQKAEREARLAHLESLKAELNDMLTRLSGSRVIRPAGHEAVLTMQDLSSDLAIHTIATHTPDAVAATESTLGGMINVWEKNKEEAPAVPENVRFIEDTFETAVESLTGPELVFMEEAMAEIEPLPIEAEEVKTDPKVFLQNQIVREEMGYPIMPKIKEILRSKVKPLLKPAVIGLFWAAGSSVFFPSDKGLKKEPTPEKKTRTVETPKAPVENPFGFSRAAVFGASAIAGAEGVVKDFTHRLLTQDVDLTKTMDMVTYNALPSSNLKRVYAYAASVHERAFVVPDKPSATFYIFGKDKKIVASFPMLLGKMKGEDVNVAFPDADIADGATSPSGHYRGNLQNPDKVSHDRKTSYGGKIMELDSTTAVEFSHFSIHATYKGDLAERTKALASKDIRDNRRSFGCINISEENWEKFLAPTFSSPEYESGVDVYVTPDDTVAYSLDPKTNTLEKPRGAYPLKYEVPRFGKEKKIEYGKAAGAIPETSYYDDIIVEKPSPKKDSVARPDSLKPRQDTARADTTSRDIVGKKSNPPKKVPRIAQALFRRGRNNSESI